MLKTSRTVTADVLVIGGGGAACTAAVAAARVAGLPCAALFSVSDNTVCDKSLVSGRTEEENRYRQYVRKALFPRILHSALE